MLEKCPHCGENVLFMGDTCPNCQADKHANVQEIAAQRREAVLVQQEENIEQRPISATINRLATGAGIICFTTFAGALLAPGVVLTSLIGCFVGLGIVSKFVFGDADVLDKLRWRRYWRGDLLGYWVSYLSLFVAVPSSDQGIESVMIYLGACVIAFFVGLANVWRADRYDKQFVAARLRRLAAEAAPGSGAGDGVTTDSPTKA